MMVAPILCATQRCTLQYADLFHLYAVRLYSTTTLPKIVGTSLKSPYRSRSSSSSRRPASPQSSESRPRKESKNLQPHRAKLGPKPLKKNTPKNPQRSSLTLLAAIKKDIDARQPLSTIRGKIFFALSIPSTPPALAHELFEIALKYNCANYKIINSYMRILSDVQDLGGVLEVFQYMKRIQQKPLVVQYGYILKCWIGPKNMDLAKLDSNFEQMKPLVPVERLEQLFSIYLSVYVHKKMYNKVDAIIEHMRTENVPVTHITYNEILSSLIKNNPPETMVHELMLKMDKDNIVPTRSICNTILNFYVKLGDIEKAMNTAEMMEKHGVAFYENSFLPLIDGFRKEGILTGVTHIINEMVSRKIPLSRSIYTSVIAAYCEMRDMGTAQAIFETMKQGGVSPQAPTYNCLINGYLKMDDVEGALNVLAKMKQDDVLPDTMTYPHFIDHFRKKENLENSLKMMQQMRNEKLPINHVTYYSVVSLAIRLHGYGEEAKELINTMIAENVTPNEHLFRNMLSEMCNRGLEDDKILEIFDLMDSLRAYYNHHQLTPTLRAMLSNVPVRADLAWEVLCRAMLQRFDLKTLSQDVKSNLKRLGLMHPIENGVVHFK